MSKISHGLWVKDQRAQAQHRLIHSQTQLQLGGVRTEATYFGMSFRGQFLTDSCEGICALHVHAYDAHAVRGRSISRFVRGKESGPTV